MLAKHGIVYWLPFAFCTFLVYTYTHGHLASLADMSSIAIWLPMCFFYVGATNYSLYKRVKALEEEVQRLRLQPARRD